MFWRIIAVGILGAFIVAPAAAHAAKTPASASHPRVVATRIRVAPVDEYFGRMKLSTLGIDNTIRDTGLREGFNPELASRYMSTLLDAEDALRDWASKYPQDGWIPKRAYELSHLFWRAHTADGNAAADRCRGLLFRLFPKSKYAQTARVESRTTVAPLTPSPAATQQQILPPKFPR